MTYCLRGDFERGRPLLERALKIKEEILGLDHWDVALGLNSLAAMLRDAGRSAEARPYAERALALFEKVLPPEHTRRASALDTLATSVPWPYARRSCTPPIRLWGRR